MVFSFLLYLSHPRDTLNVARTRQYVNIKFCICATFFVLYRLYYCINAIIIDSKKGGVYMNNAGDIIKERRKKKGLSVQKLSEMTGLARSTIYRLENGEIQNLNLKNAAKLLDPLDLSADELIDENDLDTNDRATYKQMLLDDSIKNRLNVIFGTSDLVHVVSGNPRTDKSYIIYDDWLKNNNTFIESTESNQTQIFKYCEKLNNEGLEKLLERAEELIKMGYVKEGEQDDD